MRGISDIVSPFFESLGFTRKSPMWVWSRLVSAALIITGAGGVLPFGIEQYLSPRWRTGLLIGSVLVLWLAGVLDTSPLPKDNE